VVVELGLEVEVLLRWNEMDGGFIVKNPRNEQ